MFISAFLIFTCVIQCIFSYKTINYDYNNNYSGSKDAAKFINKFDYKDLKIYGIGFTPVAINAYFDENIYSNWNKNIGFFLWNTSSEYYLHNYNPNNLLNTDIDMIIVGDFDNYYDYPNYDFKLLESKYDAYHFKGHLYVEKFNYYDNSFTIYVSKKISLTN